MSKENLSPAMKKYLDIKENYKDCILLYRMGDFYEMFFEDAIKASQALDLILTRKSCGLADKAPMCGVPYHAIKTYIARLIACGYKVAICEQLTQPKPGVKLLERDVVRVITPGTLIDEEMLEGQKNNYLLCIYKNGDKIGLSYVDISTGEFEVIWPGQSVEKDVTDLVARILPSEIIGNEEAAKFYNNLPIAYSSMKKLTKYYDWAFSKTRAMENLQRQFGSNFEAVYGLKGQEAVIISAGALFEYLNETQKRTLSNINKINVVRNTNYMIIDLNTRRNLEIVENNRDRRKTGSILWVIDKTSTSMGARTLRRMLDQPLQDAKIINNRLEAVEEYVKKIIVRDKVSDILKEIADIERLTAKVAFGNVTPKDMVDLKRSLQALPRLKEALNTVNSKYLIKYRDELVDVSSVAKLLDEAISEEASHMLKDGGFIKEGFNKELDEYRQAKRLGSTWLKELERKEIEETGIKNLRVNNNRVFGYFIEVSKSQLDKVPIRYIRKQTIANGERFITPDLKVIEDKILGSEEKAYDLEMQIFGEIKNLLSKYIQTFQQISSAVANIDALLSLAIVAVKNGYVKPVVSANNKILKIVDGRHPVVEQYIERGTFVANDTLLDDDENKIMVITGPNMAGKSTYMRQVAIITLLAHIGSFVPAKEAHIPITDRIFTRVGASDDLAFGQSTFMVEMSEVAYILANATDKSLIVLDEIGRGTSTFDGLSIAWSVIEYISKYFHAKTLFATHYHELTELEGVLGGVKNYKVSVKEFNDTIIFLRKIVRGGANKSFGIEVAKLAGVPKEVLSRAKEISKDLEKVNQKLDLNIFKEDKSKAEINSKVALNILSILKDVDMNNITPMYAFDILSDLSAKAKEEANED